MDRSGRDVPRRGVSGGEHQKIDPAQLELLFKDMPEKPEASPDADAPEEDASNTVETLTPKNRAAHRSRITDLENLPVETTEWSGAT